MDEGGNTSLKAAPAYVGCFLVALGLFEKSAGFPAQPFPGLPSLLDSAAASDTLSNSRAREGTERHAQEGEKKEGEARRKERPPPFSLVSHDLLFSPSDIDSRAMLLAPPLSV